MVGSRVYVGGLPFGVRQRDIEKFFKGFGKTRDILIKNGYGFVEFDDYRDADDAVYELNGKELLGERVVVEAARGIDRRRDYGRDDWRRPPRYGDKVSVERARGTPRGADMWRDYGRYGAPPPRRPRSRDKYDSRTPMYGPPTRTEFRLIVENLSSRISWQDLKDFMRQAGEVTYADAHKQRKNEGVVEFATHSDLRNALDKLDNTELNGRRIRLVEDRRRGGRHSRSSSSRSRSRSRRRSRSRSRSRSRRSSRSRSRSNSKTRPKSKSPAPKSRSRSKQRSASPVSRSRSRSRSKSANSRPSPRNSRERSHSASKEKSKSKSRSPSPDNHKDNGAGSDHNESTED